MTAPRDPVDHLQDILDTARKAEGFLEGLAFEQFRGDEQKVFAVTRAIEIIGEAARRIPPEVRERHPKVPWSRMAAMRDKLVPDDPSVDTRVLWDTVREDLPPLREAIARVLEGEEEHGGPAR